MSFKSLVFPISLPPLFHIQQGNNPAFKASCNYTGLARVILDNLPILKSLISDLSDNYRALFAMQHNIFTDITPQDEGHRGQILPITPIKIQSLIENCSGKAWNSIAHLPHSQQSPARLSLD